MRAAYISELRDYYIACGGESSALTRSRVSVLHLDPTRTCRKHGETCPVCRTHLGADIPRVRSLPLLVVVSVRRLIIQSLALATAPTPPLPLPSTVY